MGKEDKFYDLMVVGGQQLQNRVSGDSSRKRGKNIVPLSAGEQWRLLPQTARAGQAAVFLLEYARKVSVMIRGGDLGKSMSKYLVRCVEQTATIELMTYTEIAELHGDERVNGVSIENNQTDKSSQMEVQAVFIFIGAVPRTGWISPEVAIDENGFIKTGRDLSDKGEWTEARQPFCLQTSRPGIIAAGDVRAGSLKRVAPAVGKAP